MTTEEAVAALESGDFDAFIGVSEGGHLDFKGAPYDLATDSGKFELAKDVVAFANSGLDALIVVGIEAERGEDSPFERAKRIRLVPSASIDPKRYRDTIRERCYPSLRTFDVELYPALDDEGRCLFAIRIPPQPESSRPFLVRSAMSAQGDKVQGWLVGLPTRVLDATEHMRVDQLHETFVRGQSVTVRLEEIVGLLAHLPGPTQEAAAPRKPEVRSGPVRSTPGSSDLSGGSEGLAERAKKVAVAFAAEPDDQGGRTIAPCLFLASAPTAPSASSNSSMTSFWLPRNPQVRGAAPRRS